jgi:hypothetical protein
MLPGSYALSARAIDNLGLEFQSAAAAIVVQAALPYRTDFEAAEGYALGPIAGQGEWKAAGSVVVTDADFAHGTRCLSARSFDARFDLLAGIGQLQRGVSDLQRRVCEACGGRGIRRRREALQFGGAKVALVQAAITRCDPGVQR